MRIPSGRKTVFWMSFARRRLPHWQPFWQAESYDRWIRGELEFARIRKYIEYNPVHAGLAASPELYRWSSAYVERASRPAMPAF